MKKDLRLKLNWNLRDGQRCSEKRKWNQARRDPDRTPKINSHRIRMDECMNK